MIADEFVGIHTKAHGASCSAPLESGFTEDLGDAHLLGNRGDSLRSGNHDRLHTRGHLAALDVLGHFLEIGESSVGAAAKESDINLDAGCWRAGWELHVLDCLGGSFAVFLREISWMRDGLVDEDSLRGCDAPGDRWEDLLGLEVHDVVVDGVLVGCDGLPSGDGGIPLGSRWRVGATAEVLEGGLVRIHVADAGASLDRHVADGHALLLGEIVEGGSTVLVGVSDAAVHAEAADDVQDDILGVDAGRELAVHVDAADLGLADRHGLRGEDVAHLACADAKSDRSECTVRGGVGVAAGDRGAGLRDTLFGTDDMNDALLAAGKIEEGNSGFGAVLTEFLHHGVGERVGEGLGSLVGRYDVIDGCEGAVRIENLESEVTNHAKGLGAGHLVNEVSADQKLGASVRERANGVFLPDLIKKRFGHSHWNLA